MEKPDAALSSNDESEILKLYDSLLDSWNNQDARDYADVFTVDANVVGFDGSQIKVDENQSRSIKLY